MPPLPLKTGLELSLTVLLRMVSVPAVKIPPPPEGKLRLDRALLLLIVLLLTLSAPRLRIPPPLLRAVLPLRVLLFVTVALLTMPPPCPAELPLTVLLLILSVALPPESPSL